ncbi:MAG TPA: SDR family oxidoreductase [Sphingomonas sp.]|nr:SDR family oxidoreductase [Sphingomonas sp.]
MIEGINGKVVLITGGASGIGKASAALFAKAGAQVVIADANPEAARAAAAAIGEKAIACEADVSRPEDCARMIAFIRDRFGRLDCAFNNAGITEVSVLKGKPLPETHELPLDVWNKVIGIDLFGVFHCLQAEIPLMLESGGGAIVNTASLQGHVSFPRTAAYTAAKHGVVGLTKAIAKEYGNRNIRCNAVSPGVVDTPLTRDVIHLPEYKAGLLAPIPLGRFAEGEDIARAVLWLCSPLAEYVNGAIIPVDGGYLA